MRKPTDFEFREGRRRGGRRTTNALRGSAGVMASACHEWMLDSTREVSPVGAISTGRPRGTGLAGRDGGEVRSTVETGQCRRREGTSVHGQRRKEQGTDDDWR